MEEGTTTDNDNIIVGASAALDAAIPVIQEEAVQTEELPMIVWLKGDEDFVEDFSLDAESAMNVLGIKRSRLTQISGKELRVGRIRIDRYTRPVYRPADIQAYQKWTRATATHLRSSSVIKEAATKLEEHTNELSRTFEDTVTSSNTELKDSIDSLGQTANQNYQEYLKNTRNLAEDLKLRFFENTNNNHQDLRLRFDELVHGFSKLQLQFKDIQGLYASSLNMKSSIQELEKSQQNIINCLREHMVESTNHFKSQMNYSRDIGKALSLVIQFLRESSGKQDDALKALCHIVESQQANGNPKRRIQKPHRIVPLAMRQKRIKT